MEGRTEEGKIQGDAQVSGRSPTGTLKHFTDMGTLCVCSEPWKALAFKGRTKMGVRVPEVRKRDF